MKDKNLIKLYDKGGKHVLSLIFGDAFDTKMALLCEPDTTIIHFSAYEDSLLNKICKRWPTENIEKHELKLISDEEYKDLCDMENHLGTVFSLREHLFKE